MTSTFRLIPGIQICISGRIKTDVKQLVEIKTSEQCLPSIKKRVLTQNSNTSYGNSKDTFLVLTRKNNFVLALVISRWAMEQKLVLLFCLGKGQPKGVSSVFWNKKNEIFLSYPSINWVVYQKFIFWVYPAVDGSPVRSGHKPVCIEQNAGWTRQWMWLLQLWGSENPLVPLGHRKRLLERGC